MLAEIRLKNFQVGPVGPGQRLGLHMRKQADVINIGISKVRLKSRENLVLKRDFPNSRENLVRKRDLQHPPDIARESRLATRFDAKNSSM